MTVLDRDPLTWFIEVAQRNGLSQRSALRLYRNGLGTVSDAVFRAAWKAVADELRAPSRAPLRFGYKIETTAKAGMQ